jgi:hypothetical protein
VVWFPSDVKETAMMFILPSSPTDPHRAAALRVVAFLPLLLVVVLSAPALLMWPFIPATRNRSQCRVGQFIEWTWVILDLPPRGARTRRRAMPGQTRRAHR